MSSNIWLLDAVQLGLRQKHETTHSSSKINKICQARLVWQDELKYF